MRVLRLAFVVAVIVFAAFCQQGAAATAASDQAAAERVLGPHWQKLSRRAGLIFTGTVLSSQMQSARTDRPIPSLALRFRVDHAIAGVTSGETLTIHEWIGARSLHPPMRPGDRLLLFLYPPSSLGLTSPIGGAQGQIQLDATGKNVARVQSPVVLDAAQPPQSPSSAARGSAAGAAGNSLISIDQLERAIRSARGK